jgi:osmotically inducible lipoprotein OsmB
MNTLAKLASLTFAAVALVLVGCGSTTEERAATGAVGGAVVAGPVGAVVGAAGGAAVSKAANEPAK